ncbi:hypothetical protein PR048_024244 [Dryococelus australis]|uniref:Uncharacterized protein n=1 Tax=Dryococelus australis TaxID=614101 RepID=A0ABQ9GN49_9NEOP|nr:hypothetical protein PR048_024244 [Dryococelus australis]
MATGTHAPFRARVRIPLPPFFLLLLQPRPFPFSPPPSPLETGTAAHPCPIFRMLMSSFRNSVGIRTCSDLNCPPPPQHSSSTQLFLSLSFGPSLVIPASHRFDVIGSDYSIFGAGRFVMEGGEGSSTILSSKEPLPPHPYNLFPSSPGCSHTLESFGPVLLKTCEGTVKRLVTSGRGTEYWRIQRRNIRSSHELHPNTPAIQRHWPPTCRDTVNQNSARSYSTTGNYSPASKASSPGAVASGFAHVGLTPDDAAGRRVFSGISRLPRRLHSGASSYSLRFTFTGSQDLAVKSHPILLTHSLTIKEN